MKTVPFSDLAGKTLVRVYVNADNTSVIFGTTTGETYKLYHEQDCCEEVYIESIVGDIDDIVGTPIASAEEVSNAPEDPPQNRGVDESYTWTFYKIDTVKGGVTIRWLGMSNGYYSEKVSFVKL